MRDSVTSGRMKTYLVGGAVRDRLLGLPVTDRDWVVVGETPEAMQAAGFKPVGKDFPVFLHPETHEEYALARTERKTGPGYHGFQFNTDVSVTLEQDLARRDLTINAIAQDDDDNLVDPYNGQQDIQARLLKHVSSAFTEDPVRVLRIAKFMARFSHLGFSIAEPTEQLIRSMIVSGELDKLVPERIWRECEASLAALTPCAFFKSLLSIGALAPTMPELDEALRRTNSSQLPTAGKQSAGSQHMLSSLEAASELSTSASVRFAALCAGFTPEHTPLLERFCERLRVPAKFAELAMLSARYSLRAQQSLTLDATQLQALLKSVDAARRPARFNDFLSATQANAMAMSGASAYAKANYAPAVHLLACAQAMASIDAAQVARSQPNKTTISTAIKQREIEAIQTYLGANPS